MESFLRSDHISSHLASVCPGYASKLRKKAADRKGPKRLPKSDQPAFVERDDGVDDETILVDIPRDSQSYSVRPSDFSLSRSPEVKSPSPSTTPLAAHQTIDSVGKARHDSLGDIIGRSTPRPDDLMAMAGDASGSTDESLYPLHEPCLPPELSLQSATQRETRTNSPVPDKRELKRKRSQIPRRASTPTMDPLSAKSILAADGSIFQIPGNPFFIHVFPSPSLNRADRSSPGNLMIITQLAHISTQWRISSEPCRCPDASYSTRLSDTLKMSILFNRSLHAIAKLAMIPCGLANLAQSEQEEESVSARPSTIFQYLCELSQEIPLFSWTRCTP